VIQPNQTPVTSAAIFGLLAVPPAYQSKGIGSRLIKAALSHMRDEWKCEKCIVWVLENRPELLVWYEKMGFVWNGETRLFPFPEYMQTKADFRILEMNL
jgi:GNAT superfamily N-acetyltransferase